tara:strand:- start:1728 stop:1940 length:213 start_codon:yes stop_codon:yes gene_type:complete
LFDRRFLFLLLSPLPRSLIALPATGGCPITAFIGALSRSRGTVEQPAVQVDSRRHEYHCYSYYYYYYYYY